MASGHLTPVSSSAVFLFLHFLTSVRLRSAVARVLRLLLCSARDNEHLSIKIVSNCELVDLGSGARVVSALLQMSEPIGSHANGADDPGLP